MTDELQQRLLADQYPREHYQTQAPIGAASASLAASIALGCLLRMFPYADIASIRFEIEPAGASAHWYVDPDTPYVVCSAAEPDECPSCHTIAGQHPHTEYCRRTPPSLILDMPPDVTEDEMREFAERFSAVRPGSVVHITNEYDLMEPLGQVSQPATRTSQPPTHTRDLEPCGRHHATPEIHHLSRCSPDYCGHTPVEEPTPLATPAPHHCPTWEDPDGCRCVGTRPHSER